MSNNDKINAIVLIFPALALAYFLVLALIQLLDFWGQWLTDKDFRRENSLLNYTIQGNPTEDFQDYRIGGSNYGWLTMKVSILGVIVYLLGKYILSHL